MSIQVGDHTPESFAPKTPDELMQFHVETTARDGWMAVKELCNLADDRDARAHFSAQVQAELLSIQRNLAETIGKLRVNERSAA